MPWIDDRFRRGAGRWPPGALCLLLAAVVMVAWGCGAGGDAGGGGAGEEKAPQAVEAVPARHGSLPLEEVLSGVVRARNQVAVRPEISAPVMEVLVRNGDRVTAGQPLVRLNDDTRREQLQQAEASLRLAEAAAREARARVDEITARVTRTRVMAREGLVSDLDLETDEAQLAAVAARAAQDEARVEQARATVGERRAAMARTVVRSPVDGVVGRREVEVGMLVDPSTLLFLVGDFTNLVVEISLTQEMLETIEVGTLAEIETRRGEVNPVRGEISRISPFLERSSFSTEAEIEVVNREQRLFPGMYVIVRLLHGSTGEATLVPFSALREDPRTGLVHLFVVEETDGLVEPEAPGTDIPDRPRRVVRRQVELVSESRGAAGVRGAAKGEWVVTLGHHLLDEAMKAADADSVEARVRPTSWQHVLGLEALQREDLLEAFLARQQEMARVLGAELPETREEVDEAVRAAEAGDAGGR